MKNELRIYGRIAFAVVCAAVLIVAYHWAADKFRPPPLPATYTSQVVAETPQGVKNAAKEQGVYLTPYQQEEAAKGIKQNPAHEPTIHVETTPENLGKTVEKLKDKTGAQVAIVTDAKNPGQAVDPKKMDQAATIHLDAHLIEAFPKSQAIITVDDESVGLGWVTKVKIKAKIPLLLPHGATGYAGPYIRHDWRSTGGQKPDTHYGGAFTVTF